MSELDVIESKIVEIDKKLDKLVEGFEKHCDWGFTHNAQVEARLHGAEITGKTNSKSIGGLYRVTGKHSVDLSWVKGFLYIFIPITGFLGVVLWWHISHGGGG